MVGRRERKGRAYDTTRTSKGKEKEERDTRRKCFGKFRFAADIDTKFLSNRRDLLYMNDNQWRSAAYRNLISENVLRRWMRTTTASLDDSWKLAVYLPFFRTVHGIWKPFHERKGIRNVLFPTCLSHVQAGRYIRPAKPLGGWSGWLTWTIAHSSSTFPQLVISLWSGGQLARNFEKFSLIRQPSLYNYIEAKIRIYI